jgi:hypothetical protein
MLFLDCIALSYGLTKVKLYEMNIFIKKLMFSG